MNPKAYRLPTHILPRHYEVALEARLGVEDFRGQVLIQLDIIEARDVIELHARDLHMTEATLTANGQIYAGTVTLDPEPEIAVIRFAEPLPVGAATLALAYNARLNKALKGLYLAKDGPEQLLCTQCEETDARAIFPCWDEPTFKARFAYRITTAPDATVLTNSPLLGIEAGADGQSRTWVFAPTRPISTYLVALVIGDLAATPEEVVAGIPLRVWALRGKEHMGAYAQEYTRRLLPWFEDYFGTPYHFDKYDQVAVPGFAAGAMENVGLVTFRQHYLLMDPRTASWRQEKDIAHTVAHEFAHMWFGDLVTMRWWDDLWLNEAFAEWIAYKAVDALSPDYALWDDFQAAKSGTMNFDALESTHPIYTPVETAAEASELFDRITYDKGCAVLRMLEHFVGAADFRAGLRTYMRAFAEGNATSADLWRHLQSATQDPIAAIMESWIIQPGFPVVRVELREEGTAPRLHLRQQRFYSRPGVTDPAGATWQVPLVVRYEDDAGVHETRYLLAERAADLPLAVQGTLHWCHANADEIGFYRQDLAGPLLDRLPAHRDRLTPTEQQGLLGDQWALTRQGSQRMGRFLDVLAALVAADDYNVLAAVVGHLHTLEALVEDSGDEATLGRFHRWVADVFRDRLAALGFAPGAGETQKAAQQRVQVVEAMVLVAEDPAACREATIWADREAADPTAVDPNVAPLLVMAAAQFGDVARFDHHLAIYQRRRAAGTPPQETNRYLHSLPAFRDPALVHRVLELLDDGTLPQESLGLLTARLLTERHSRRIAWDFLQAHWAGVVERLDGWWFSRLVETFGRLPADLRDDIVAFCDAHLQGLAQQSYARALEILDQQAEFEARTRADLLAWFQRR